MNTDLGPLPVKRVSRDPFNRGAIFIEIAIPRMGIRRVGPYRRSDQVGIAQLQLEDARADYLAARAGC